jgi:putative membrane protein
MDYGHGWGMGGSGMGFGFIFWLLILALVVWGVVSFVRSQTRSGNQSLKGGLELLEERYARGEINREEYLQKKRDIAGDKAGS